jgi:hypothetical protein
METQDTTSSVYRILMKLIASGPPVPSVTITSFGFAGTSGSTSAQPSTVITSSGGVTLTWTLFQSASTANSSFSSIATASPAISSPNTITYASPTIASRWYYYTIAVTNASGTTTVETAHLQNVPPLPTASITSFTFAGTLGLTTANPTIVFNNSNATSMTVFLFQSASTSDTGYSLLYNTAPAPTGTNTVNYVTTIKNRWYYWTITVTNASGSNTYESTHLQNLFTPTTEPPQPTIITASITYDFSYVYGFYWGAEAEADSYKYSIYNISNDEIVARDISGTFTGTSASGYTGVVSPFNNIRFEVQAVNAIGESTIAVQFVEAPEASGPPT